MSKHIYFFLNLLLIVALLGGSSCLGPAPEINYDNGFFPEEVVPLEGINSAYDDFNSSCPQLTGEIPLQFATNRESTGSEFDILTGVVWFIFDQKSGDFTLNSEMASNQFYDDIEAAVNTDRDQLGPYYLFNSNNGYMYFFYTDEDESGDLDLRYLSFLPPPPGATPQIGETSAVSVISSSSNDGYLTFNSNITTAYFTSDRGGDYDIYEIPVSQSTDFDQWLISPEEVAVQNDSLNSAADDKCPFIWADLMIFASDRSGGFGGFDLYYSVFSSGKWSSPINLGPDFNTEYNEYRPIIGLSNRFTNNFMVFSSDRPGGMGGYDLYFSGISIEELMSK